MLAFAISPLVCWIPLLPIFCSPLSPCYIAPLLKSSVLRPFISSLLCVVIVSTLVGLVMELSFGVVIYVILRRNQALGVRSILTGSALIGGITPLLVLQVQHFPQRVLVQWLESPWIHWLGAASGIVSGMVFIAVLMFDPANNEDD